MSCWVIGVDGGGTKTQAVIVNEKGQIKGRAVADSSNIQAVGEDQLAIVFNSLARDLSLQAGIEISDIDHIYAGLAGAARPADQKRIRETIEKLNITKSFTIDTDAMAALAGAFSGKPGMIVISGTGAICFGKDDQGNVHRCGGWGYLLGDEGSGFYLGQQAIIAALKAFDGRGEQTELLDRIVEFYNLDAINLIISPIYSGQIDRTRIASLAPVVFELARKGDQVAKNIIDTAGNELGKIVAATTRAMSKKDKPVRVALIGSVFKQRDLLVPHMEKQALTVAKSVEFIDPECEPSLGSALLGLQTEGIDLTQDLINTLKSSC